MSVNSASQLASDVVAQLVQRINTGVQKFLSDAAVLDDEKDRSYAHDQNSHVYWGNSLECRIMENLLKNSPAIACTHGLSYSGARDRKVGHLRVVVRPNEWMSFTPGDLASSRSA